MTKNRKNNEFITDIRIKKIVKEPSLLTSERTVQVGDESLSVREKTPHYIAQSLFYELRALLRRKIEEAHNDEHDIGEKVS